MVFLYDNVTAMMIGGMVLLIALTSMQRLGDTQVERTATYMVKAQANDFATWMEEDLLKMHEHVASEEDRPVPFELPDYVEEGATMRFCFRQDSTQFLGQQAIMHRNIVRYRLRESGTRTIQGSEIPVYYLERTTRELTASSAENWRQYCRDDDSSHWRRDGWSTDLISYFRVDMLDRNAQPVNDPVEVEMSDEGAGTIHNTRVRFAMVTPFDTDRTTLREVYYGATLILEQ